VSVHHLDTFYVPPSHLCNLIAKGEQTPKALLYSATEETLLPHLARQAMEQFLLYSCA
jgi:hypothetical protein